MCRVVLLCSGQLSLRLVALVQNRVLSALVVWLRQVSRNGEVASVSVQHSVEGRAKSVQHWG